MINIDILTLGCEFKDSNGEIYKVTSNFSQNKKLFVELDKVEHEEIEPLIEEK